MQLGDRFGMVIDPQVERRIAMRASLIGSGEVFADQVMKAPRNGAPG